MCLELFGALEGETGALIGCICFFFDLVVGRNEQNFWA